MNTLRLHEPYTLTLESPCGATSKVVDVYATRRMLEAAQSEPTEADRWRKVNAWIAEQLSMDASTLTEYQAQQLQAKINVMVSEGNERLKKSITSTASSPPTTLASQETS